MAKKKAKPKSVGLLTMSVNGHTLTGEKNDGRWAFDCASWPDLADKHTGDESVGDVIKEFMERAFRLIPMNNT